MIWVGICCALVAVWGLLTLGLLTLWHRAMVLRKLYGPRPRHRLDTGMIEVVRD